MQKNESPSEGIAALALGIMIVAIFLIPLAIQLIKIMLVVALVGGMGYIVYMIIQYDHRTGNVTHYLEKRFELPTSNPDRQQLLESPQQDIYELPPAETNRDLEEIKTAIEEIKRDRETIVSETIKTYGSQIEKQKGKELMESIFSDDIEGGYNEADMFEKREHFEKVKKKEEELTIRGLKQEVAEELLDHKTTILEHKYETRNEFMSIRQEMSEGFMKVKENLLMLAQDMMTFKTYVVEKFSTLELAFMNEMNNMKMMLKDVHTELKQEISQTKLQFGQEILRIDRQQLTIIDKMRDYEAKVRAFGLEVMKVKMDAERFAMRGQEMLSKAQILQERHKVEVMQLSKDINLSLEKMAVREEGFANKVGSAKIQMEHISNQQYLALKDMAFERIGINALREDYQKRVTLEETKIARLNDQQRNILQQIQTEQAHGREISGLQHQLSMTKEDARHSQHQLSMYQQEAAQVRRLSN